MINLNIPLHSSVFALRGPQEFFLSVWISFDGKPARLTQSPKQEKFLKTRGLPRLFRGSYIQQPVQQSNNQSLTSEQKETIGQVLSGDDSENLTAEGASNIVEVFREAGIKPSETFASELADAGFEAQDIGDLAKVSAKNQTPPPPPQNSSISSEKLSSVVDYLDSMTEDDTIDLDPETRPDDMYRLLSDKFGLSDISSLINSSA